MIKGVGRQRHEILFLQITSQKAPHASLDVCECEEALATMQCLPNVYDRAKERTSIGRVMRISNRPRKVGQFEHAQTV